MAQYRVNVTMVYVYATDVVVEAESEREARSHARDVAFPEEPDVPQAVDGWVQVNAWVGDDWEFEVLEPDLVEQA